MTYSTNSLLRTDLYLPPYRIELLNMSTAKTASKIDDIVAIILDEQRGQANESFAFMTKILLLKIVEEQ